jgi:hypothetical protein
MASNPLTPYTVDRELRIAALQKQATAMLNEGKTPSTITNSVPKSKAQSVFDKLDGSKRKYNFLKYPLDVGTDATQNIMLININAISGSSFSSSGAGKYRTVEGDVPVVQQKGSNSLARKMGGNNVRIDTAIALHMPPTIETSYQSTWNASNLGTFGAIMDAWTGTGDLSEFSSWKSMWESSKEALPEVLALTGVKVADSILPGKIKDSYLWANQMVENPYVEVLFEGVSNRTFTFTFKFIAKSAEEQVMIKKIIDTLKFHRAPEKKLSKSNLYWSYPSTFDITFLNKQGQQNNWLFKISTCALTDLNIKQGGENHFASFEDGSPFMTVVTMSFIELSVLDKSLIKQGF